MAFIQIGSAVKGPAMWLCPQCKCINGLSAEQQARYGLAPAVVFTCGSCGADVGFHRSSEQWELRG